MKHQLVLPVTFLVVLAACGGDDKRKAGGQAEFETVQEGSAAGVTSTIQGPGETIPPITATNVDTTTAFTLNPNVATTPQQPVGGTLAGTFPDPTTMTPTTTGTYRPPVARPAPVRTTTPRPVETTEPAPAPTQTTDTAVAPPTQTTTAPPTSTTTTTTTSTQPPPPASTTTKPPANSEREDDEDAETDTAPPPPPPSR
jgi:hypothetical protein